MKMYEVGGCVRDELLGTPSKDIDYSVVLEQADIDSYSAHNKFTPYEYMVMHLETLGVKTFKDDDGDPIGHKHLTARGLAPKDFPNHPGRALDFVLARKDGEYSDGRRPDSVEPGTLYDDLARRDFTMNAIAKDTDGNYIDPFNGRGDILMRQIRAVGDPMERLTEDALRAVRAMRFAVTKGFLIDKELSLAMKSFPVWRAVQDNIADERIKDELSKMFRFDTVKSLRILSEYPALTSAMFSGTVSLDATMKTKGRGK